MVRPAQRLLTAAAASCGGLLAVLIAEPAGLRVPGLLLIGGAWLVFGAGAWLVHRLPVRAAVVLIVLGAIGLPLAAAFEPPRSSDDLYRYVWDGRVQASGIDPYRYPPESPELAHLRDDALWPERANWCVASGCTLINRPAVPTIYPPVAEAYFFAVHVIAPRGTYLPLQLAATGIVLGTTIVLLLVLADPRRAVLWAWCPVVAYEAGSNAHVDVLAAGLAALALARLASARTRPASLAGGVLLGLAVATKLTPALLLPAVVRRRPVAVLAAVAGAVAVVYLPHVLAVGAGVLGYLPGYLSEEGYANGARFALLSWLMPRALAPAVAVALLAVVAVRAARTADPDRPWHAAATVTGAALLVAAPAYPWYALLLVVLVALGARAVWLGVAAAGYLPQFADQAHLSVPTAQRLAYGLALAALLVALIKEVSHTYRPVNAPNFLDQRDGGRYRSATMKGVGRVGE
jgi:hypothetical protein